MIKKGILLGGLFVFCFLGILFALSDSAPSENREVRTAQDAIAAEELSWQAEVTPLSLLSREERLKRLGGRLSEVPVQMTTEDFPAPMALPALLDWRDLGGNWITSIKDQGDCGSCWAFATTALLEAMVKISKHMSQDIDLSEQMLLSCSNAGDCVLGGYEYKAAEYIKMTGIPNEGCYPYTATEAPCNPCAGWAARAVRITSWSWVSTSVTGIETALQSGPVTSWMGVYSDFYHYRSGIYQPTAGSSYEGGHFVVIVGYNHAEQYWICKNSWGTGWGESGFFRIKMGTSGIGTQVLRMIKPILDNVPPVLQNIPDCSGEEERAMGFTLSATDSDGDPLEFSADSLPEGAVLDAASGAFSWTPTYTQSGVFDIRFKVSDGISEDAQTVKITVTNVKRVQW
jgi:C1A family cysteine protease